MTLRQTQQQLSLGALIWVGSLTVLACISANTQYHHPHHRRDVLWCP